MAAVLMRFPGGRRKAYTMSYDDGSVHDKRFAETLARYAIKATLNIQTREIGFDAGKLSWDEIKELAASPLLEIAAHGHRHLSLAAVEDGVAAYDVVKNREMLEDQLGCIVRGMAYANGSVNDRVLEILSACGMAYARTTASTEGFEVPADFLRWNPSCHHTTPRLFDIAKTFLESEERSYPWHNRPMLFYVWGHSHEFAREGGWELLEKLCEYVGGRDDIWYATNGEIVSYVNAYRTLIFSHDQSLVHNPSATDLFLTVDHTPYMIPAGGTVCLS